MKRTFFKKLLLTLSVLLISVPIAFSALAASPSDFVDFPSGWSNEAVTAAVNNGLLNGRSANRIEPEGNLTRAEMATIINRAFGATIEKSISSFSDVSPNEWYYHEIAKAYNMQTFQGDASGTMRPDSYITREEVFAVIARALVLETIDFSSLERFNDKYAISQWAKPYAAVLVAKGYVNGDTYGNLNPLANITREEFAQIMHNIVKTYHITAGEHKYAGPSSTLIRVGGVTLSDVVVEGDLILGDGVGKGNVTLVNVTIKGRLLARGGEGKVTLTNTTVEGGVVVKDVNGIVNFNNYRKEAPFAGIREITKATFLGETSGTTPGGSSGGGGGGGGGGASDKTTYYIKHFYEDSSGTETVGGITYKEDSISRYVGSAKDGSKITISTKSKEGFTLDTSKGDGANANSQVTFSKTKTEYKFYYNKNTYSVTIKNPDGAVLQTITYKHGDTLGSKFSFGAYPNRKFYSNGSEVTGATTVTSGMTITSKDPHKVIFNHNDGHGNVTERTVYTGDAIGSNLPTVTRDGYTFKEWTVNSDGSGQVIDSSSTISEPITVYAQWNVNTYKITHVSIFDVTGTVQTEYTIETGATLPVESDFAAHTGFIFDGWYKEDTYATKVSSIAVGEFGNITLYAKWLDANKTYHVFTFNHNYDSKTETVRVEEGSTANKPADPIRIGYTFGGWYTDSACTSEYDFASAVNAPTTIYAKWTINTYSIEYDLNGGSFKQGASYPTSYSVNILPLEIPTDVVEYAGKKLEGWYKDDALTQPVTHIPANTTGTFKVYAKWEDITYTVTIVTNGVPGSPIIFTYGQTIGDIITTQPTKEGYDFAGYNTAENGSGKAYTSASTVDDNLTLYTQWTPITYQIHYDLRGGEEVSGFESMFIKTYNIEQSITLPIGSHIKKAGYNFAGWYKTSDDSLISTITLGTFGNINLYAKWEAKTYKVIYDGNSNTSGTMDYTTHKYDEVTNLSKNTFAKTGHTFIGWSKVQGSTSADFSDEASVAALLTELEAEGKTEIILYAVWKVDTYTLTFNVNGGKNLTAADLPAGYVLDGNNAKVQVQFGSTYPELPTPQWVDVSKRFVGWAINGTQINKGEAVVITENSEVVAIWTDKAVFEVKIYDFFEGTEKTVNVIDGEKIGTLTGMKKTGYTFDKFYKHGTNDVFDTVNTAITGNVELDAKWTPNTYTIKYSGNGNTSGAMTSSSYTYGILANLSKNDYAKTGYTFLGWSKTEGSSIVNYTDEADVSSILTELATAGSDEITLYAVWSANTYFVNYNKNDALAEGSMTNSTHKYEVSSSLSPNAFTKTGYTFNGWNTNPDGSGTSYANMARVSTLSNEDGSSVTLYAQWKANTYYVEYVANGGSGSMTNSTFVYDASGLLNKNLYARTGYTFAGWSRTANAQMGEFADEASVLNLTAQNGETIKLYAVWTPITYKIVYKGKADSDSFAVSGSMENSVFTYDAQSEFMENAFVRNGYKFVGWKYNNVTYIPNNVYSALNFTSVQNEEITVYAVWERISYTVKYHPGVNTSEVVVSGTTADSNHYYDEEKSLTTNNFVRTGYTFKGWTTTPPAGLVSVMNTMSLKPQAEDDVVFSDGEGVENLTEEEGGVVTLYAVWEANRYKITYFNDHKFFGGWPGSHWAVYDEQVNIASTNTIASEGYDFVEWNTSPDGTGTGYEQGKPAINLTGEPDATVVLYPISNERIYYIQLKYRDDTNAIVNEGQYKYTDVYTFPGSRGYIRTGYTFAGWVNFSDNLSDPVYVEGESFTKPWIGNGTTKIFHGAWTPNKYKVSFNVDGGKPLTDAEIPSDASYSFENGKWVLTVTYDEEYPVLPRPEWKDASKYFAYWINEADGSKIVAGQTVKITEDTVLTAVWTDEIRHTVVFTDYNNDGTSYVTDVINGFAIQRPNDPPQREGYTFVDWYADRYHGQYFDFTSVTHESAPTTFTAYSKWKAHKFTVIYNGNGATDGGMNNSVYSYGNKASLKDNAFIKPGYIFDGWTTNPDGTGTYYENKADVTNLSSVDGAQFTLYAKWKETLYTVIFDGNGASGVMDSLIFNYTENVSLPANAYIKKGYTFLGWSEKANASAPSYNDKAAKAEFINALLTSDEGAITLYAVWSENSYTVVYDANSGIGSMKSVVLKYNDSYTLAENAFTRKGYEFLGWNTKADGTGIAYEDKQSGIKGITAQNGATVTLYAQWKIIEYSISYYDAEFVDVSKVTYTYTVEDEIALPDAGNISGENFLYWADENNMPVQNIIKGSTGNKKFTAVYGSQTPTLYTVTFMADGVKFNEIMVFEGSVLSSNTNYAEPSKQGFNFLGWNTRYDGSGTYYDPDLTKVSGAVTLYAIFEEIPLEKYPITYNNVDSSDMADASAFVTSYTEEDEINLPSLSDFNERANGEVFAGWYDNANYNGEPVTSIPKGSTGAKTYWAKWAQKYVVTFYDGPIEDADWYIGEIKVSANSSVSKEDIDGIMSGTLPYNEKIVYNENPAIYTNTINSELWYIADSGEWKKFDESVVITSDMNVYNTIKYASLFFKIKIGGFEMPQAVQFSVPYQSDTRLMVSLKDAMAQARNSIRQALNIEDIYTKAIETAAQKTSEKDIVLVDSDGNIKFVEVDVAISNIIKPEEIDGEIAKYIEKIIVENIDDEKIASAILMVYESELIKDTVLGGLPYDFANIKSYISGLSNDERVEFAKDIHDILRSESYYHDFIDAFEDGYDHFVVSHENLNFVMAVATAVNEYTYEELKDKIYAKFGKVIDVLGDDIAKEFMHDSQVRYYEGAHTLWDDMKAHTSDKDYKSSYPSYLTFKVNAIDHLFKPMFDKYRVKVIDKLNEKNFYHYTENTPLRSLVEMDADTIVNELLYSVPQTEENIGYALWPRDNGESGFMHYYDYIFNKLLVIDDAMMWYKNNLTETELEQMRMSIYEKAAKAFNKANEMLAAYEKDGSLPMGKNISDLMEIEAFAKVFNKVEDKLVKALEKFKTTKFYGKEWTAESVRYEIPYSNLASDVILGIDEPVFNIDSLLDDKYVGKAFSKAGFKEFTDNFDIQSGAVTIQAIERILKDSQVKIRRYYR